MKKTFLFILLFALFIFGLASAQGKNNKSKKSKSFPESFSINKSDFEKILNEKVNFSFKFSNNAYLDNSVLQMNTKNGDMHFVKLKLTYFPKSYLLIQENGMYSTVIFIMSDDKSVFYKGKIDKEVITMRKCSEDDIVSE